MRRKALLLLVAALAVASHAALTDSPAGGVVRLVTSAIQNQQQALVFPGLLSTDFKAYVGGWGPTTCDWYTREAFIIHIDAWQSTWSTNTTLFNIRESIVSPLSDGTTDVVLNLQIAYFAKPEFGGPTVNAYDVFQVWKVNAENTQILSFLELSALVQPSNSSAMQASTQALLAGLNSKNATAVSGAYNANAMVTVAGVPTYNYDAWMKEVQADFTVRQNDVAFFSEKLYATCDQYVWWLWTSIRQYDLSVSSNNSVSSMLSFSILDDAGLIQTQNIWAMDGVVSSP